MSNHTESNDLLVSIQRTLVPIWAAWLGLQAARAGIEIPGSAITDLISAVVASAYYLVVRPLEVKFPQVGILLGSLKQPVYADSVEAGE